MPRGDKSSYTDKQKRKAKHIEKSYEKEASQRTKPNGAPGQPSTQNLVAGINRAPVEARKKQTKRQKRVAGSAEKHRPIGPHRNVQRRPRKLQKHARPMPGATVQRQRKIPDHLSQEQKPLAEKDVKHAPLFDVLFLNLFKSHASICAQRAR
jgi:hypothetical protein